MADKYIVSKSRMDSIANKVASITGATGGLNLDQMQSGLTTAKTNFDKTKAVIREMTGATGDLSLEEMTAKAEEANAQIEALYTELEELSSQLDGKAAGSAIEMSHVALSVNASLMKVSYTTVDDDGKLVSAYESINGNYFEFDAAKGSMFSVWVQTVHDWEVESSGCELLSQWIYNGTFGITDTESVVAIDFSIDSSGGSN